ncbi:Uncharacterized protein Adt_11839 [Abeliophyllum distichum]|uniref:Uncharacterized protein n=1 Tax=Abeliophyllum distichum TaxID=126358 RepID=A0ABD1UP00_9LAMI
MIESSKISSSAPASHYNSSRKGDEVVYEATEGCFHECSPEDSKIDSYVDRRQQMMIAFDISGLLILNTCVLNSISYKLFREFITLLTSNLQSVMPGIQLPTPPPPPPLSPTHEEELDSSRDEDYLSDL